MNPAKRTQSCQLVDWAIQRVLQLRYNRAVKFALPNYKEFPSARRDVDFAIEQVLEKRFNRAISPVLPDSVIYTNKKKIEALTLCHCGCYYKKKCKSCAGRISRSKHKKKLAVAKSLASGDQGHKILNRA